MRKIYWVISIVVIALVCGVVFSTPASYVSSDISDDSELIDFSFMPPEWLEGYPKQDAIEQYIQGRYDEVKRDAVDLKKEFPDSVLLPFVLVVKPERIVLGEYESILLTDYAFTGGAHGNTTYVYYTLKDGNDISLREYLETRQSTEEQLIELTNAYLERDGHSTVENIDHIPWQIYQPSDEAPIGIRLLFPPYAVASYAEGTIAYVF